MKKKKDKQERKMKRIKKIDGLSKQGRIINESLIKVSNALQDFSDKKNQEKVNPLERVIIGEMLLALLEEYITNVYDADLRLNFNFLQLEFGENLEIDKINQLYKIYLN